MIHEDDAKKWQTWKTDPTPDNLSAVLRQMSPVIHKAIQINQGNLSPAIVEAQAKIEAVKAFKSFKPDKGVKLSTHVTNYMQKVNRLNYKYQEAFSVPEVRRIKWSTFNSAKGELGDQLGRDPNTSELADSLGWSQAEVGRFNAENRHELSDSQPHYSDFNQHDTRDASMLAYVYNDLSPRHKLVLEHTTGYNNKKVLDNQDLMKKLRATQGQVSYYKTQIKDAIRKAMSIGGSD